jgi:hypothetical protein
MKTHLLINLRLSAGIILLCFLFTASLQAQQLFGTYSTTTPEASMYFLNPGYLNPAQGAGVLGMNQNPAALRWIEDQQFAAAFALPQTSEGEFLLPAIDSTDIYSSLDISTQVEIEEAGGISAIGYGRRSGRWTFGIAMLQAGKGGFSLEAAGSVPFQSHFQVEQPVTREEVPDLPVEEIPVTWDVTTDLILDLTSDPAELYVAQRPFMASVAYNYKHIAFGIGLTYYHIYSSQQTARLNSRIYGRSSITGTPNGIDPKTNEPWRGSFTADIDIDDNPLVAEYRLDVSGSRWALSAGTMINFKLLSLGVTYSYGLPYTAQADYRFKTVHTVGLPDVQSLTDAKVTWQTRPELSGSASLTLTDFAKDSLFYAGEESFDISGIHRVSAGLKFLIFGLFAGGELSDTFPGTGSFHAGVYMDFPIPSTPLRFNSGFIQYTDAIRTTEDDFVPYRVVSHLGMGLAMKVPLLQWVGIAQKRSSWLHLGVRSSLTSLVLGEMEKEAKDAREESLPSLTENLALSFGLSTPL